ncbi:hypothetical protein C8R44DRAFT_901662 [Mycena epipterygia]|nr:hypothetical protein C8R44DRAFT_901662 [Mycena epipterygia]
MKLSRLLLLFIILLMAFCSFCGKSVGTSGMGQHRKSCREKTKRLQESSARAVELEQTRIESVHAASAVLPPAEENPVPEMLPEIPREPSPLPPGPSGRPRRRTRLPARYRDDLPEPPTPIAPAEVPAPAPPAEPTPEIPVRTWVQTEPNAHGLYKVFPNRPTHDPEDSISLDDLCRSSDLLTPTPAVAPSTAGCPPCFPFLNSTVARLMTWFHTGSNLKSIAELDALVNNIILHEDFDKKHLEGFSAARENKRLDDVTNALPGEPPSGWKTGSVKLKLPAPKVCVPEQDAAEFEVTGIIYRPLLDVMIEAFQSPAFMQFHITPFESRYDPNHDPENDTVLYGEIYTSPSMLKAHNELSRTAEPHLETIIAAYMFWSDSTHLANFGDASLWPLYTYFGNLTKYIRGKPNSNSGHHQAYFPSVCLPSSCCTSLPSQIAASRFNQRFLP